MRRCWGGRWKGRGLSAGEEHGPGAGGIGPGGGGGFARATGGDGTADGGIDVWRGVAADGVAAAPGEGCGPGTHASDDARRIG